MEIKIGKTSGFCYGVKNAVEKAEAELSHSNETVYCLGELVHNKNVTEKLKKNGLEFIEDIEQTKGKTIIRAHGVKKEIYQQAQKKNIELVDLTCPNVLKIHNIVQKYALENYYIFVIGERNHPEVIGTYSFCGKNSTIISNIEEVEETIEQLKKSKLKKLLIISQTTFNIKLFEEIVKDIRGKVYEDVQVEVQCTICNATELRQRETEELSKEVDLMIIVGGKNSSNTNKLYDISCKNCNNVIFAENEKDIEKEKISGFEKIGIMAGASTPKEIIQEIVRLINNEKELQKV